VSAALEAAWQDAGWGPRRASPVVGHDPPLLFSLRWPDGWKVDELQGGDDGAPSADSPLGRLRVWGAGPAAITTQRVTLRLPRPGRPDFQLLATLSASLADVGDLPEDGVRVRSTRPVTLGDDLPSLEVLVVRHMLQTPFGVLALAFSALQPDFYDVLEPLFERVAQTVRLDPCAP
jgi:hypothetical protein